MSVGEDVVYDEQTGRTFPRNEEDSTDTRVAIISVLYLLLMLAFFLWQLFDIWIGQFSLADWVGYDTNSLNSATFRLFAYAFIGGGLGGVVNGLRSIVRWHAELGAFGKKYIWKYISDPWMGGTLALFVYTLTRSGAAVIGGDVNPDSNTALQLLFVFGMGALAGYGSRNVFIWLDAQVNRIFKVEEGSDKDDSKKVKVPDLIGKSQTEAEEAITGAGLKLGKVTEEPQAEGAPAEQIGTVIRQDPEAGSDVNAESTIDIVLAVNKE